MTRSVFALILIENCLILQYYVMSLFWKTSARELFKPFEIYAAAAPAEHRGSAHLMWKKIKSALEGNYFQCSSQLPLIHADVGCRLWNHRLWIHRWWIYLWWKHPYWTHNFWIHRLWKKSLMDASLMITSLVIILLMITSLMNTSLMNTSLINTSLLNT